MSDRDHTPVTLWFKTSGEAVSIHCLMETQQANELARALTAFRADARDAGPTGKVYNVLDMDGSPRLLAFRVADLLAIS